MKDRNEFYILYTYRPTLQATVFCRRVLQAVNQSCKSSVRATAWLLLPGGCQRPVTSKPSPAHASLLPATICSLRRGLPARSTKETRQGKPGRQIKQPGSARAFLPAPFQASVIIQPRAGPRRLRYRRDRWSRGGAPRALQSRHHHCWKHLCCLGTT